MTRFNAIRKLTMFCNTRCPISRDRCDDCPIGQLMNEWNDEHAKRSEMVNDAMRANLAKSPIRCPIRAKGGATI